VRGKRTAEHLIWLAEVLHFSMWQDDENDDDKACDKVAPGAKLGRASELFSFIINDALAYFSGT